jgi:Raf kinase inhibitor-like YbhB/YbcL family protein
MQKYFKYLFLIFLLAIITVPIIYSSDTMEIQVTSTAFKEGEMIPRKYTCRGENISPQIAWSNIPEGTKSFLLIADDPDAPMGTWVHWVVYNIPANFSELKERFPEDSKFPDGIMQGITDFGTTGYGGPCPPSGIHRYYFKLYAIDIILDVKPRLTKQEVLNEIEGHILAKGQLMGKFRKN